MSSVYTPTATKLVSITLPDDGDAANASSSNTPDEALADGVLYAQGVTTATQGSATSGTSAIFLCDSAVTTSYQDSGIDLDVAANVGDKIIVNFSFSVYITAATGCFIDVISSDFAGAEVPGTEKIFTDNAAVYQHVTLSFMVQALATATITFEIRAKCATGDFSLYAGLTRHALVVRP
jgi:hypothetical protein